MGGWSPRTRSVGLSAGDPDDEPEGLERKQLLGRDADQEPAGRRGLVILQHIPHETVGVSALKIALQCVWDFTAVRL